MSDKTEAPTPRRRKRAKQDGDSGASAFAAQSLAFCVAVALAPSAVRTLATRAEGDFHAALDSFAYAANVPNAFDGSVLAAQVLTLTLPLLGAVAAASAIATLAQTGGTFATKRLSPDLSRLNPFEGIKKLVSGARLFAVARALAGASIVAWMAVASLRDRAADLAHGSGRLAWVPRVAETLCGALAIRAAALGLALAVVDALVTRITWTRRLRMSAAEVKREHREAEGDPQIKAARERAHHELLSQATVAQVKNASVVVVNPVHLATALRYVESVDEAPKVIASGEGDYAQRIAEVARDYGIPVLENVPLAHALAELRVGDAIPEALYETVAAVLREAWGQS